MGIISTRIAVFSVYVSPNCDKERIIGGVEKLCTVIRRRGGLRVIICGDFNAKHTMWGGNLTNERGKILLNAVSRVDLVCPNGDSPTYSVPERRESYINLCFVNIFALRSFKEWKLQKDVTLSDHNAISNVFNELTAERIMRSKRSEVTPQALEEFGRAFEEVVRFKSELYPDELTNVAQEIIGDKMSRQEKRESGLPVDSGDCRAQKEICEWKFRWRQL